MDLAGHEETMKRKRWIGFVAARYVKRGRKNSPSPVFSVLGIATGVLALTVIIAVMNGFQLGFIESILEISSCHMRIEGLEKNYREASEKIRSLGEVSSVLPFEEVNVLLRGKQTTPRGALLRGVPANALELDPGLSAKLDIEDGFFDLQSPENIVLGAELARFLFARVGDEISLLSITGGAGDDDGIGRFLKVTGIFRSGFYEYDLGWGFVNMETAASVSGRETSPVLGIKLKNRWQDQKAAAELMKIPAMMGINGEILISSWRDYNRAFFGALRTEKLMMFILVGLIFIVVGLNIFQAQRRIVLERREEIGLLRAMGASDTDVRLVFALDGFITGFVGASLGLVLGLLIALNIPVFFSLLETCVNFFISVVNNISYWFGSSFGANGLQADEFSVFSPRIFYIKEIPSRIIPSEVFLIFMFGFLSALAAAWFASGKVSDTRPAEVLRYE